MLPRDARVAIEAARRIYADIGRAIGDASFDSVTRRAHTTGRRKAWLLARSLPAVVAPPREPSASRGHPEALALVRATLADARATRAQIAPPRAAGHA